MANFVQNILLPRLHERFVTELGKDGWQLVIDRDDPDIQTLLFAYPSHFGTEPARYVRPIVKIEFGARSDPWPAHARVIQPVVAEVFPQLLPSQRRGGTR